MNIDWSARPEREDYADYFQGYISLAPDGDVLATLAEQMDETSRFLLGLGEELSLHRYAEGKWSIRELVGHLNDTEQVFAYRGLCISRGETNEFFSYDQDAYVAAGVFDTRPLAALVEDWRLLRRGSLRLFGQLDAEQAARRGISGLGVLSVRCLPWILAGHELHHLDVIRERYLA